MSTAVLVMITVAMIGVMAVQELEYALAPMPNSMAIYKDVFGCHTFAGIYQISKRREIEVPEENPAFWPRDHKLNHVLVPGIEPR